MTPTNKTMELARELYFLALDSMTDEGGIKKLAARLEPLVEAAQAVLALYDDFGKLRAALEPENQNEHH